MRAGQRARWRRKRRVLWATMRPSGLVMVAASSATRRNVAGRRMMPASRALATAVRRACAWLGVRGWAAANC